MPGIVSLDVDTHAHALVPFDAQVTVTGAPPGATVTASLKQTRGRPPLWPTRTQPGPAGSGTVTFTFAGVVLEGPTLAVLVAEATDTAGTAYAPDAERIEVL